MVIKIIDGKKQCLECKKILPVSMFYKNQCRPRSNCKICFKNKISIYSKIPSVIAKKRKYHREYVKRDVHKRYLALKKENETDEQRENRKKYLKAYHLKYRKSPEYKDKIKAWRKTEGYRKSKNRYERSESYKEKKREYVKKRRSSNIQFKLRNQIRCRFYGALNGKVKSYSAVDKLGCTIVELKKYLEGLFLEGMSWDNWSKKGWHIDHIKPLSLFDLSREEDVREACNFKNLQPLWANDNLVKSNIYPLEK